MLDVAKPLMLFVCLLTYNTKLVLRLKEIKMDFFIAFQMHTEPRLSARLSLGLL